MYRTTALINFMTFYWTMLVRPHFFNNVCFMYARSSTPIVSGVFQVSLHNADLRALYDIFQFMPICVHSLYNPFKNNPSVHGCKRFFYIPDWIPICVYCDTHVKSVVRDNESNADLCAFTALLNAIICRVFLFHLLIAFLPRVSKVLYSCIILFDLTSIHYKL